MGTQHPSQPPRRTVTVCRRVSTGLLLPSLRTKHGETNNVPAWPRALECYRLISPDFSRSPPADSRPSNPPDHCLFGSEQCRSDGIEKPPVPEHNCPEKPHERLASGCSKLGKGDHDRRGDGARSCPEHG